MATVGRYIVNLINAEINHESTGLNWQPFAENQVDGMFPHLLGDSQMETFFTNGWLAFKLGTRVYAGADGFDRLRGMYDRYAITFTTSTNTAGVGAGTYFYYGLQLTSLIPYVFPEAATLRAYSLHVGTTVATQQLVAFLKNGVSTSNFIVPAGAKKFNARGVDIDFEEGDELALRMNSGNTATFPCVITLFFSSQG